MDELKKVLLALGVSEANISALAAEEKPEDFDSGATIKEIVANREKFYLTKLTPTIEEAYEERVKKDRYAATIKPIQNRLEKQAKALGATPEELEGADAKALVELIAAKQDAAIASAGKTSDEELRKELNETRKKLTAVHDEFKATKDAHVIELENVKKASEQERKQEKIAAALTRTLAGDEFKGIKDVGQLDRVISMYMNSAGYDLDLTEDGKLKPVMAKDRSDAINIEGNSTYASATDMLLDVARTNKLFPTHNGGEGKTLSTEMVINGEKKTVGGNVSWLKEQMAG